LAKLAFFSPASIVSTICLRSATGSPVSVWTCFRTFRASLRLRNHSLDAFLAQVDLPAGLGDVLVVLRKLCLQVLALVFAGAFFAELPAEGVVAPVDLGDPVDELDDPFAVNILLDKAVLVLDVVHDTLHTQIARFQLLAHPDKVLHRREHAEDGIGDLPLAFLDFFGDLHFLVAVQERHEAHLAQVHLDRVAGPCPAGKDREQLFFPFFLGFGDFFDGFLQDDLLTLVCIDDVDVLLPEEHDDLVDLVRRDDVRREHLVDVVVGQEPLFLPERDEFFHLVGLDILGEEGFSAAPVILYILFAHGVIVPFHLEAG